MGMDSELVKNGQFYVWLLSKMGGQLPLFLSLKLTIVNARSDPFFHRFNYVLIKYYKVIFDV